MDTYDVRIHYAANNLVTEDARWRRIALGVAAFKPTRRLRLSDTIIDVSNLGAQSFENASQSPGSTQPITVSSEPDESLRSPSLNVESEMTPSSRCLQGTKRKTFALFEGPLPHGGRPAKRTASSRSTKRPGPPSENPISSYLRSVKTADTCQETPASRKTLAKTVLVPVTGTPKCRRAFSVPIHKVAVRHQDSSPYPMNASHIDETSFLNNPPDLTDEIETRPATESFQNVESDELQTHRYPGNQQQPRSSNGYTWDLSSFGLCKSPYEDLTEAEVDMGTSATPAASINARFNVDDKLGKASPEPMSCATTETPSNLGSSTGGSSPLAQRTMITTSPPVIDLTVPFGQSPPQVTRNDVFDSTSSPTQAGETLNKFNDLFTKPQYARFSTLPRRVMCHPKHNAKSRPFESFLPPNLSKLARRFCLVDHFRPISAPISIQNTQRGYWKMRISITDMEAVLRARRPPLSSSQWSDQRFMMRQDGLLPDLVSTSEGNDVLAEVIQPNLDPESYIPWTTEEFVEFWTHLARIIESGRAGYDVRATFKSYVVESAELRLDLQVYGYAETLSHLWLVLYGLSNALTARMPLQWYVPGTGPVLTMSGQPKRSGKLGRWLPLGTGVKGSWGLEGTWEGLASEPVLDVGNKADGSQE